VAQGKILQSITFWHAEYSEPQKQPQNQGLRPSALPPSLFLPQSVGKGFFLKSSHLSKYNSPKTNTIFPRSIFRNFFRWERLTAAQEKRLWVPCVQSVLSQSVTYPEGCSETTFIA
jgi:hypothetical protein